MNLIEKYNNLAIPVKAASWALACGVLQRGIQVVVTPVFTRIMTMGEYGEYIAFTSWLEILGIFLTFRLYYGVFTQGLVRYDYDKDEYTSSMISLMSAVEVVVFLVYIPTRNTVYELTGLTTIQGISIFIITWSSGLFEFWCARQRVEYRYKALALLTVAFAILQPAAGVLAVLSFPNEAVDARVSSMAIIQVIAFGWILFFYQKKRTGLFANKYWLHAVKFSLPLIPHYLSLTLLNQVDRIMIARMISNSAAGIYGLAYSLSFIMAIVNQAILNTMNPWIYQQIKAGDYKSLARVSYLALALVAIANLLVVAIAPEAIAIFAPVSYQEGVYLVPPLAASVVVTFLYSLFADFEFYYERTQLVTIASVIGAFINAILNFMLIPHLGYWVAAWTTLFGYLLFVLMHYLFMRGIQKKEIGNTKVYSPLIITMILAVFGISSFALALLYPYLPARIVFIAIVLFVLLLNKGRLLKFWSEIR